MSNLLEFPVEHQLITCCECGIDFSVSEKYYSHLLKTGKSFYCPNGHGQHYSVKIAQPSPEEKRKVFNLLKWRKKDDE